MVLHLDMQDKVSRDVVPADNLFAHAASDHRLASLHSGRNVERHGDRLGLVPFETTVATASGGTTRAVTGRAGLGHDKHVNHADTATHLTVLLARLAHLFDGHLELFGAAVVGFEQRQEHLVRRVRAPYLLLGHSGKPSREASREPAWEALGHLSAFGVAELVKVLALLRV